MATFTTVRIVVCPACQSEAIQRHGYTRTGFQRFRCKDCRLTFSDAPSRQTPQSRKEQILAAYQERASMRGIARVHHISRNTLTKWLKEKGGSCPT